MSPKSVYHEDVELNQSHQNEENSMLQHAQTGTVEINGSQIYYEIAGEGSTVVLSHAAFVDSRMWDAQWEILTQQFRVIRFDMRGFGKSEPVSSPVSRRDDLYQLLQHLNVEKAHLVGCSLSGTAILDLALEHPELVASLVIVSSTPSGFELQGETPRYIFEMMDAMQTGDFAQASELAIRIWFDGMFREPDQVNASVRAKVLEMNRIPVERNTFFIGDSQPFNPLTPPALERLNKIAIPTLIIAGDLDHPEIVRASDLMAAQIPNAQEIIVTGTAHLPNMEKPVEFNQELLDFLRSVQ